MEQLRFGDLSLKEHLERRRVGSARMQGKLTALQRRLAAQMAEQWATRCPCGLWPWEHERRHECGPRNQYRRHQLAQLYRFPVRGVDVERIGELLASMLSPPNGSGSS
jgi:hypothetical protein